MSQLEDFWELLGSHRRALTWALGGSAMLPILAGLSGVAPAWPEGVILLTSMYTLITVVVSFVYVNARGRAAARRTVPKLAFGSFLVLVAYLAMQSFFVTADTPSGDRITLGCGWSDRALQLIDSYPDKYFANPDNGCPGFYESLLRGENYQASLVWTHYSVAIIRLSIALLWLAFFTVFSFTLGQFLAAMSVRKLRN